MKRIYMLPIMICLIQIISYSNSPNNSLTTPFLEELRLTYYKGVENDEYIDTLNNYIDMHFGKNISQYQAVVIAYKAGVLALESKHAFWPFSKMSYLNDSMDLFELAVEKEPDNLEIRFMRFSILYYVPGILGYDDVEASDLEKVYSLLLERDYSIVDIDIQIGMIEFLIQTEMLTDEQIQKLENEVVLADSNE